MTSAQNGAGKDTLYANGKPGNPGPGPDGEADDEIEWLQYHKSFEARGYNVPDWTSHKWLCSKIIPGVNSKVQTVNWLAWACDGKRMASCGYEKVVRLWHPDRGTDLRSTVGLSGGHSTKIDCVAWSPVHKDVLASASCDDKRISIWDARLAKVVQGFTVDITPINIQFSPDGKTLMGWDSRNTTFSLHYNKMDVDLKGTWVKDPETKVAGETNVMDSAWLHNGGGVIVATSDGWIRVLEYPSLKQWDAFKGHWGQCNTIDNHPRGGIIATGGTDSTINVWNLKEQLVMHACNPANETIQWLRFSHDGEWISASVTGDNDIYLIATETGEVGHKIETPGAPACMAWNPQKLVLAACGEYKENPSNGWISFFGPTTMK